LGRSIVIHPATGVRVTDVTSGASVAGRYQNSKGNEITFVHVVGPVNTKTYLMVIEVH